MIDKIIKRLKSKTYWAAIAGAALSVIEINSGMISRVLPLEYREWAVMFWPVIMIGFREVTNAALADK